MIQVLGDLPNTFNPITKHNEQSVMFLFSFVTLNFYGMIIYCSIQDYKNKFPMKCVVYTLVECVACTWEKCTKFPILSVLSSVEKDMSMAQNFEVVFGTRP
jgi:hypothetical protein